MIINEEDLELPNWIDYAVKELDYYSDAERHDLICRYKLTQIYQNFCIARMHIIFSDERTNYGDLDDNVKNKKNIQKIFIQNALIYYNFCIDLSWTMVYLYCLPQKHNDNITNKEIEDAEKIVNYEFITEYLKAQSKMVTIKYKNKINNLLDIIVDFWNEITNDDFRYAYNYTKHQGAYDIIGINFTNFLKIEGIETKIDLIKSKEFDVTKITNMLIKFNNNFVTYMNKIIKIIINPANTKNVYNFGEILGNIIKNKK